MSKKKPKKEKLSMEILQKEIEGVKKLTYDSRILLGRHMKSKPLESAAIIFVVGLVLGILIGQSKR